MKRYFEIINECICNGSFDFWNHDWLISAGQLCPHYILSDVFTDSAV